MHLMELENVRYSYGSAQPVLRDVSLALEPGKLYAILGPSGCGKTTLLSLMGGLDAPDAGTVRFGGEDIAGTGLAEHRKHHVAFVFQSFNLIDYLTPAENVALITRSSPYPLLEELGLTDEEARRNVLKLSGGQKQRVAIARALASEAPVILADEPTGNLDEDTAAEITGILRSCAHKMEKCVVVVTHSRELARKADCVLRLKKGVVSQEDVGQAGGSASRRNPSSRRSRP
ncbi:ABC transporter ATP-binding protein [Eggerthella guodeyinii]|uniref:ATP-binding cassette domain-containing protein n=1 Tax=Eggerthella guodeyinii TaxID=2690837 RepID=A0A6N7RPJ4_9ACTN|nr:ABC transporter ATP-binding protein [Eggerthella guodeyinii]MRX83166.1 ATP-binding cassette domain-containing protein [Eggerthella guodeyinii]